MVEDIVSTGLAGVHRALVVGLGRSGLAAIRALAAAGVPVVAVDDQPAAAGATEAQAAGASVRLGVDPCTALDDVDLVVPSPGVPEHAAVLAAAHEAEIPVWSEPELGWRLHPRRLVAVTGTNGKTSVTELIAAIVQAQGWDAVACGNIGLPFTDAAAAAAPDATLVAELSSFQLRFAHTLRPVVGLLTNVAPDHLDWHADFDAYAAAKARLWQVQHAGDWAVVNADDPVSRALATRHAPAGRAMFSATCLPGAPDEDPDVHPAVGFAGDRLVARLPSYAGLVLEAGALPLDAPHHRANVAAAATAALLAGADVTAVAETAARFRPGRHRLEVVATGGGVAYVDDSKATNAHAAAAALASFDRIVWIAGGLAKGVDLGMLAERLDGVVHAVVIGEAGDQIAELCRAADVPVEHAGSMEEAVKIAGRCARPGDTVLLAPACASFDMFRDYADRGEQFAAAARVLTGEGDHGRG